MPDASSFLPPRASHELPRTISSLYNIGGFDTARRSNIYPVDDKTILYAAGNSLVRKPPAHANPKTPTYSPDY